MNPALSAAILARLRLDHPDAVAEHRFHHVRRWRFDFAIPSSRIAIEIDGGVWIKGRHSGGQGQIDDMEKFNTAAIYGWRTLKFTPQQTHAIYAQVWAAVHHRLDDECQPVEPTKKQRKINK